MTEDSADLVKVHIDLPNHWLHKGESMWAKPLGNDLYEIHNVPFCAYGLNCRDVVLAIADAPDLKPEVRSVVRRSGNRTFRLFFQRLTKEQQEPYVAEIERMDAWVERANEFYICINVNPTADYNSLRNLLDQRMKEGVLEYETCEERSPGSFDDVPQEQNENEA
jgi:hypothetical protein